MNSQEILDLLQYGERGLLRMNKKGKLTIYEFVN